MLPSLRDLIKEARTELGSDACKVGKHLWEPEGGRSCPEDLDEFCGQTVYRCSVCGQYDYGESEGPAAKDCANTCKHKKFNLKQKENK